MKAMIAALLLLVGPQQPHPGCQPYPVTAYSPTGIVGCEVYGTGTASRWQGPGVARNDCEWPWRDCTSIRITSLQTGRSVVVTPTMFCDCYTGTPDERIVDLDPKTVAALGLNPAAGLWPVTVEPARAPKPKAAPTPFALPDTAVLH